MILANTRRGSSGHDVMTSPCDDGQRHRSECNSCGTVLKAHATEAQAIAHAVAHRLAPVCETCRLPETDVRGTRPCSGCGLLR